jgi:predicted RNA-binding Zn ribbon-like protein
MPEPAAKSPFEYTGGTLSLDFANTVNQRGDEHGRREELLTDYMRLLQWAEGARIIKAKVAKQLQHLAHAVPGQAHFALRRAIRLREAVYAIFLAVAERRGIPSLALARLNVSIKNAAAHARIVNTNRGFTSEWIMPESSLDSLLWPVARAASELLTSDDLAYVRRCASESCAWLFLDKTKNHRRRWCEMKTCGNRDKARRYYQRQKAG